MRGDRMAGAALSAMIDRRNAKSPGGPPDYTVPPILRSEFLRSRRENLDIMVEQLMRHDAVGAMIAYAEGNRVEPAELLAGIKRLDGMVAKYEGSRGDMVGFLGVLLRKVRLKAEAAKDDAVLEAALDMHATLMDYVHTDPLTKPKEPSPDKSPDKGH